MFYISKKDKYLGEFHTYALWFGQVEDFTYSKIDISADQFTEVAQIPLLSILNWVIEAEMSKLSFSKLRSFF